MVKPGVPRLECVLALLPERQEQPAAGTEEREPLPIMVRGLDELEGEDVLVERQRSVEIGDGQADVAGSDHGSGRGHGDLLSEWNRTGRWTTAATRERCLTGQNAIW